MPSAPWAMRLARDFVSVEGNVMQWPLRERPYMEPPFARVVVDDIPEPVDPFGQFMQAMTPVRLYLDNRAMLNCMKTAISAMTLEQRLQSGKELGEGLGEMLIWMREQLSAHEVRRLGWTLDY